MTLVVYNALSRQKEPFVPREPGRIFMYVCGPTVYDHAHIGHAKMYVSMDVIVRHLRHSGYALRYVQNITDVGHLLDSGEDRILKGARRERVEPMEVVERYMRSYLDDMDALHNTRPDIMPRASGHVPEQIAAVQQLLAQGNAYEVNGSVYFDVSSHADYGKLSGRRVAELEEGARVAARDDKRRPEDFALWKRAEPEHIMRWPSPWGEGFPGWHIECSAMAMKYLGQSFDIHGGGIDNIFPHNECEMAQSEALTGCTYANYWLLAGSLTVDGVKMSKSLGNSITIKDALRRHAAEVLRFFVLSGHYSNPSDVSEMALGAAQRGWERLLVPVRIVRQRLQQAGLAPEDGLDFGGVLDEARAAFRAAMDDDFNAPAALAALFELTRQTNAMLAAGPQPGRTTLAAIDALYTELGGGVLGVIPDSAAADGDAGREAGLVQLLIEMRMQARARKDFAASDNIRDSLRTLGIVLEDGKDGTTWKAGQPPAEEA